MLWVKIKDLSENLRSDCWQRSRRWLLMELAFGAEGYIRMSYATSMEQLREGVTRIKRFVEVR